MTDFAWWQRGVIYQIYPRSFQDGNGDGVGDLAGIRRRLDYLAWLGVDALWIPPIYPSPMADFGYDIADHCAIDPLFGTLDEFDVLLAEAHERGLRVILDFVPNHTSDRHPWFEEARRSRDARRRDWYLWADPGADGGPPNNWRSHFGGAAWTFDPGSGQYYLHTFLAAQPDLNWRNPEVAEAMAQVMRFWLDRGVDGLRLDAIWHLIKDRHLRNNPPDPGWHPGLPEHEKLLHVFTSDRPEVQPLVCALRDVVDEYRERVLIGELYLPIERVVAYYGARGNGIHLPANALLIGAPWDAESIGAAADRYEALLPTFGWPNWALGNHDKPRIAGRVPRGHERLAALLLLTLRGTPTLYYGDELGMRDGDIPPAAIQDPIERNMPGLGRGRDPQRTPMPWDDSPHAGFSTAEPWLPLSADGPRLHVAGQQADPASLLHLYRRLLQLRRAEPALAVGRYLGHGAPAGTLHFEREHQGRRLAVALNFNETARTLSGLAGQLVLSTLGRDEGCALDGALTLLPGEGAIVALAEQV
ncbi:alpha-amylase family glycosyl hydrolase [Chitiniphilus shinanonensis]|uniref:alpha-amylase family glycosyl hydrolase n=1 Tax=Chitiniphilus shinanonensis TaxID=553088 RepID=UPI00303241AC